MTSTVYYRIPRLPLQKPIRSKYPLPMELLPINNDGGQGYGYIVYRKVIGEGRHLEIKGYIQDKAWVGLECFESVNFLLFYESLYLDVCMWHFVHKYIFWHTYMLIQIINYAATMYII